VVRSAVELRIASRIDSGNTGTNVSRMVPMTTARCVSMNEFYVYVCRIPKTIILVHVHERRGIS
jgi:hypothetical protein